MGGEWRPRVSRILEELQVLSNNLPVTPDSLTAYAPLVIDVHGTDSEVACNFLRQFFLWEDPDNKYLQAASIALGFDPRFTDPSKQQRLSDAAPYYGRVGWRNMYRWATVGFEIYATWPDRMAEKRNHLFDFTVAQRGNYLDFTAQFFRPPTEAGEAYELSVRLNEAALIFWTPDEDNDLYVLNQPIREVGEGKLQHVVAVGWNSTAPGRSRLFASVSGDWELMTTYGFQTIDLYARRAPKRDLRVGSTAIAASPSPVARVD